MLLATLPTLVEPPPAPWPGPAMTLVGSTRGATSAWHRYSCAPATPEGGPEVLHRLDLPSAGVVVARVRPHDGADLDVHLLTAPEPSACVARGDEVAAARVGAGPLWVVVDGYGSAQGAWSLELAFTGDAALRGAGVAPDVAADALALWADAWRREDTRSTALAIVDFALPSDHRRLWVLDLATGEVRWHLHVAHGDRSSTADVRVADAFSNVDGSHQSSLGLARAAEAYDGVFGHSVRLDGLEPRFNDRLRPRAVVLHPWWGVRPEYVQGHGAVWPTWGCPAVDDRVAPAVADFLAGGGLIVFHHRHSDWARESERLARARAAEP